jgi:hypothetical protein
METYEFLIGPVNQVPPFDTSQRWIEEIDGVKRGYGSRDCRLTRWRLMFQRKTLNKIYRTSGMLKAAPQAGIELNRDTTSRPASYSDGIWTKHFDIITPVYEASAGKNSAWF